MPQTTLGKVIASLTMFCGIIVIALPISVLGNNFTKLMQQYNDESIIITQADIDGSGFVDATEVGRWLQAMRKAGKIRDERLTAEELIRRYDKGGKVRDWKLFTAACSHCSECCAVTCTRVYAMQFPRPPPLVQLAPYPRHILLCRAPLSSPTPAYL